MNINIDEIKEFDAVIINPAQVHQTYWGDLPVKAVVPSAMNSLDAMLPRILR